MIYRFDVISVKVLMIFFTRITRKAILKHLGKYKRSCIGNTILNKKNKAGGVTLPHFKIHKVRVINMVLTLSRYTDMCPCLLLHYSQ
jgi:hypothetical protein